MGATDREFQAQSGFIAACDDPTTLLEWMREYRDSERASVDRGDDDEARQMDDLAELAEDRAIELKAALIVAARPKARAAETPVSTPAAAPLPPSILMEDSAAELRRVKEELAASREAQGKAERQQARAERERIAAIEAGKEREREAASAKAAAEQAAAATAPAVNAQPVPFNRSPERVAHRELVMENERLRLAAARALAAQKPASPSQPLAGLPTRASRPAQAAPVTPVGRVAPTDARAMSATTVRPVSATQPPTPPRPAPTTATPSPRTAAGAELTPLARLFQQRLTGTTPTSQPARQESASRQATRQTAPPTPPVAPPPTDPVDDLPPHTGADLLAYRTWLGVDQRALAVKFGVGQGTISKGESRPTTLLGPALRKALHEAMSEPRPDVGGAP